MVEINSVPLSTIRVIWFIIAWSKTLRCEAGVRCHRYHEHVEAQHQKVILYTIGGYTAEYQRTAGSKETADFGVEQRSIVTQPDIRV